MDIREAVKTEIMTLTDEQAEYVLARLLEMLELKAAG